MYDDYEIEYEPSLADEILKEASDKLMSAIKDETVRRVAEIKGDNKRLERENEKLQQKLYDTNLKEAGLVFKQKEIEQMAKRMPVKEFLGQRSVIMYKVDYSQQSRATKCDKCDDRRHLHYKTPSGNNAKEMCACAKWNFGWQPKKMVLSEMRKNNYKLLMWFKPQQLGSDGYTTGAFVEDKDVYDGSLPFTDLDKYKAYFSDELECKLYCDWLNGIGMVADN